MNQGRIDRRAGKMKLLSISLLLFASIHLFKCARTKKVDIIQPLKFGNCDETYTKKTNYSYFENMTLATIGKGQHVVNGYFINNYAAEKTTATYKLYNCKSQLVSDCELFGSYMHSDFCATATEKGQYYSTIFSAFTPRLTCPLKRMVYKIENATADASASLALGKFVPLIRSYYWLSITRMIALPEHKEFGCMKILLQFAQIRA